MGPPAAGEVVLLPFPFSDLSRSKFRPALLIAGVGRSDWIAVQITSNPYGDPTGLLLQDDSFAHGGLDRVSYVRPGKLFTAHESLVVSTVGTLRPTVLASVREAVIGVIRSGT